MKRILLLTILVLGGCGESSIESIRLPGTNAVADYGLSVTSYQQTLFPIVRQYCGSCHANQQSPYFAHNEAVLAHDALLEARKVNFQDPSLSPLVKRLSQQYHGCWTNDCSRDAKVIADAIQDWADLLGSEASAGVVPLVRTADQPMPNPLIQVENNTNQNNVGVIQFDLRNLLTPPPQTANLRIRVRRHDQFSYYIDRIIVTASEELVVRGIHILINGIDAPTNNTFHPLNLVTAPNSTNPISSAALIAEIMEGPENDRLMIGFEELRPVSQSAQDRFNRVLSITQNVCIQCHSVPRTLTNGGIMPPFATFTTEAEFINMGPIGGLPYLLPGNVAGSLVNTALSPTPRPGVTRMPAIGGFSNTEKDRIQIIFQEWINGIAPTDTSN